MTRVAIYCRVSKNSEEVNRSLDNQILSYIEFVEARSNWQIQGIYIDRGISGANMKSRDGFLRMLRHCEEGKIDFIITKSISRFSRNTHDLLGVIRQLRRRNIDIYFEKEGLTMSETDHEFLVTMYAAIAQQEVVNISKNIEWAFHKKAIQGRPYFQKLYGYRIVKNKNEQQLEIIPEEAAVVKHIFDLYTSGKGTAEIIKKLTNDGIPTKTGKFVWSHATILGILQNEKYTGNTRFMPTRSRLGDLRIDRNNQRKEIYIENSHPAIISQEQFLLAQQQPRQKKTALTMEKKNNSLSGRVVCGHCSANYATFYQGKQRNSFACTLYRRYRLSCPSKPVWQEQFLDLAIQAYKIRFLRTEKYKYEDFCELVNLACNIAIREAKQCETIIQIARINQQLLSAAQQSDLLNKKMQLEAALMQIDKTISIAERDHSIRAQLMDKCLHFSNMEDALDHMELNDLLALIPCIEIYSDHDAKIFWFDDHITYLGDCTSMKTITTAEQMRLPFFNHQTLSLETMPKTVTTTQISHNNLTFMPTEHNTQIPLRVCAYCRTSSSEERHISSLARQIATYTHIIMTNPAYSFAGIYVDHGKTGLHIHGRTGFQHLIEDAKANKFDMIITKSVARFGRNAVDVLRTVQMLRNLPKPVIVYFENENIRSDAAQYDFMLSLHAAIAQNEAQTTGENVRWGVHHTIFQGTFRHPGRMPYGYRKASNGSWIINEQQAAIVAQVFLDYINGSSPFTIADKLRNMNAINSLGNNQWTVSFVYRIVHNEVYIGHYLYGKTYKPDFFSPSDRINHGAREQYYIEDHHPPIIDVATWQAAQAISEKKRLNESHKYKSTQFDHKENKWHLSFKKKLYCAHCDQKAVPYIVNNKKNTNYYWRCATAAQRIPSSTCNALSIRHEAIEHAFMILLMKLKDQPDLHEILQSRFNTLIEATIVTKITKIAKEENTQTTTNAPSMLVVR